MRIPAIRGLIDRRILVNFRIDPHFLSAVLPPPFRPQIVNGFGIAGICLIRLVHIRPKLLPACFGLASENAAHRVAVEWDADGETCTAVFVPRRDTSSLINAFAGGRLFPGVHNRARFDVRETEDHFHVSMKSLDNSAHVLVDGHTVANLPHDSIFPGVAEVSRFFESGSVGYSPQVSNGRFDGLELRTLNWHVQPLSVARVESSFFSDRSIFPPGEVTLDNALLMRSIEHEWHSRDALCCAGG